MKKIEILLTELKKKFSAELLREIEETFEDLIEDEIHSLYVENVDLFNNQDERFYDSFAIRFVEDMNNADLIYFSFWEALIEYTFNETSRKYFYETALRIDSEGNAANYINGFINLREDKPEVALFYFNKIDSYTVCYFLGVSYFLSDNYENAIINYNLFLKELETLEPNVIDSALTVIKWNIYRDLGYCYNRTQNYEKALFNYDKGLEIFDLEGTYELDPKEDFEIFVNNYLLSLEKTLNYSKCIEVLDLVIEKFRNEFKYYNHKRDLYETKLKNKSSVDEIITKLFKPKKPFNIGEFERTKLISKEKNLEDMIVEQIKYGFQVFNKDLEIYQDDRIYGRQYYISEINGFLDLLLIDKKTNILYIVELKRNEAGIEVVAQIEKYIYGLKHELNKEIRGIICLHKPKKELTELVNKKDNIELFTYNFEFTKI